MGTPQPGCTQHWANSGSWLLSVSCRAHCQFMLSVWGQGTSAWPSVIIGLQPNLGAAPAWAALCYGRTLSHTSSGLQRLWFTNYNSGVGAAGTRKPRAGVCGGGWRVKVKRNGRNRKKEQGEVRWAERRERLEKVEGP